MVKVRVYDVCVIKIKRETYNSFIVINIVIHFSYKKGYNLYDILLNDCDLT